MPHTTENRLVDIYVAVSDFYVETTIWISANPGLVVYWRSLTAKIGQWNQVTYVTLLAFW